MFTPIFVVFFCFAYLVRVTHSHGVKVILYYVVYCQSFGSGIFNAVNRGQVLK